MWPTGQQRCLFFFNSFSRHFIFSEHYRKEKLTGNRKGMTYNKDTQPNRVRHVVIHYTMCHHHKAVRLSCRDCDAFCLLIANKNTTPSTS